MSIAQNDIALISKSNVDNLVIFWVDSLLHARFPYTVGVVRVYVNVCMYESKKKSREATWLRCGVRNFLVKTIFA